MLQNGGKAMEAKELLTHQYTVSYGRSTIPFSLNFSDRATLAIHVYPNKAVVVDAPYNTALDKVETRILKRARWIRTQQAMFDRMPPALPARKYISGETFRYLGRQYRLKVEQDIVNKVVLQRGRLFVFVTRNTPERVKELIDTWYKQRAIKMFAERFIVCQKNVLKTKINYAGTLHLRIMKTRWGSCTKDGKIILNPELIAASKDCIDYVITHELCHLKEHHHGKEFYDLLTYVMPDWKARQDKLNFTIESRKA